MTEERGSKIRFSPSILMYPRFFNCIPAQGSILPALLCSNPLLYDYWPRDLLCPRTIPHFICLLYSLHSYISTQEGWRASVLVAFISYLVKDRALSFGPIQSPMQQLTMGNMNKFFRTVEDDWIGTYFKGFLYIVEPFPFISRSLFLKKWNDPANRWD